MSRNLKTILVGLVFFLLCGVAVYFYGFHKGCIKGRNEAEIVEKTDTLVVVRLDTITLQKPVYLTEIVVDSVKVPIEVHDTTFVEVPITQRHYHQDSTYDAWVSGYRPSLDSIAVYQQVKTIEVTRWEVKQAPRWSLGVTAGPSLLYDGTKIHAGIGLTAGLQYRF